MEIQGVPVKDFHELRVWQKAHQLTLAVCRATAGFPREERYGRTSQLRRCSCSIPANLAEGCGRNGDAEFARFCSIAMGSARELEYHLLACDCSLGGIIRLVAESSESQVVLRGIPSL